MEGRPPTVAVFNTSPDTVDMLRIILQHEGFVVIGAYTYELRDAKIDIEDLVRQHHPDVIIYDVAPPYDRSWRFLEHIRSRPPLAGRQFVVTATHVGHVREIAGRDALIYEVVGKPFDVDQIVRAVKEASRARSTR